MKARKHEIAGCKLVNSDVYFTTYSSKELSALQYGLYCPQAIEVLNVTNNGARVQITPAANSTVSKKQHAVELTFKDSRKSYKEQLKAKLTEDVLIFMAYFFKELIKVNGHRKTGSHSHKARSRELCTLLALSLSDYAAFRGVPRQRSGKIAAAGVKMLYSFGFIDGFDFSQCRKQGGPISVQVNAQRAKQLQSSGFWIQLPLVLFSLNLKDHPHARALYCYIADEIHKDLTSKERTRTFSAQNLIEHTALGRKPAKHFSRDKLGPIKAELNFLASLGLITWQESAPAPAALLKATEFVITVIVPPPKEAKGNNEPQNLSKKKPLKQQIRVTKSHYKAKFEVNKVTAITPKPHRNEALSNVASSQYIYNNKIIEGDGLANAAAPYKDNEVAFEEAVGFALFYGITKSTESLRNAHTHHLQAWRVINA